MRTGREWRFLVVEDVPDINRQIVEAGEGGDWVSPSDTTVIESYTSFKDAAKAVERIRFDMLIVDLKDDSIRLFEDDNLPGLKLIEDLQRRYFVPIVYYTALPQHVRDRISPFVRVVEKSEGLTKLGAEIRKVFATGLPALSRYLENQQRQYMWDFVENHWKDFGSTHEKVDIAYLLARYLAMSLRGPMIRQFLQKEEVAGFVPVDERKIHPMEMYIHPPVGKVRMAGDILRRNMDGGEEYWVILTPSCDFEHGNANHVLLAQCDLLVNQPEYVKWRGGPPYTFTGSCKDLESLLGDNRQPGQRDRFKFLPGTFFLPDLVVDLQRLIAIPKDDLGNYEPVASLDSPFAESLLSRFAKYFGRLGIPDIDKPIVLDRLKSAPRTTGEENPA
jgi:CheY-like chemotaxis protein